MRGLLGTLSNSRLVGTYLRLRVGLLLAGILSIGAASILLGIGGLWGVLALLGLVVLGTSILGIGLLLR